ncbi:MAG: hypothetical protein HY304_08165 [candidate division Zixibacteria bacterium]|nr:hypothetical protein [candidate division Zixibacteria bacterium]
MEKKPTRHHPADLTRLRRTRARTRRSLVDVERFAQPPQSGDDAAQFLDKLPLFLKASEWRKLLDAIAAAHEKGKPIFWLLGAHVLKCGLSPIVTDLLQSGLVDLLAFNGAGAIHDLEIAFMGRTSEDVAAGLREGRFGMARDTSQWFAGGVRTSKRQKIGLGEGIGRYIRSSRAPYRQLSLLSSGVAANIPSLVFPAIGAEIVAQHPEFDGAAVGAAGHLDFRILAEQCRRLHRGGVALLFGSAVILPEVFLKALSVARNRTRVEGIVTANFDMIQHYRPNVNVVSRPTLHSGRGYSFTGHHELMLPLLAWSIKSRLGI